ncbi:MAG: secY, partial [Thermoleophilia bacterium]|nr:secY [Thermoleophilia bacterium]
SALGNVFVVPDLRRKLFFTLAMLALYRLGSFITVPGIPASRLTGALNDGIFDFLNLWTGGGLGHAAVFGLGIMPFITASIIMQLMTVVVPSLAELQKEGETGYMKINRITRYLTVVLALFQSIGFFLVLKTQTGTDNQSLLPADFQLMSVAGIARMLLFVVSMTAGTILLMWIGELITQRGIGNGMSLLIFASIISGIVPGLRTWLSLGVGTKLAVPVLLIAITAAVVFIQEGQRRIPVQYAKRMVGRRMTSGGSTYLPLRVNMAGVIPIIFASALMAFPTLIASSIPNQGVQDFINTYLGPYSPVGVTITALFVILFTFFYTLVQFNPVDQADNLKKYGGFIPGVRPGAPTAQYLNRVITRLTFSGALYLAILIILPAIFVQVFGIAASVSGAFGGTTILIVVGVALDTMRQMESQLTMRNYEGFLK